jgi:hypothetical protein
MLKHVSGVVATAVLALAATVAAPGHAGAADGEFAWTKITTPSSTFTYQFDGSPGAVNQFTVSGQASGDVSSVHIYCILGIVTGITIAPLASNVPVSGGAFSTDVTVPDLLPTCRLRALPTNLALNLGVYLGAYSGPIMYSYGFTKALDGAKTVGFAAGSAFGSGRGLLADATTCGVRGLSTIVVPDVEARGPLTAQCTLGLEPFNLTGSGISSASAIRVDEKNAYLPGGVKNYLRDPAGLALTLTQSSIAMTFSRNNTTGDVKVTESEPLKRCNGDNTFPPNSTSCASLVDTGVTLKRVLELVRGSHQVLIHDSWVSTDGHAHTVTAQYQVVVASSPLGEPGYIYPKHGSTFHAASFGQVVTGFGTGAASVLVRSNLYASTTDTQAATHALSWSRPPLKIQFAHNDTARFAMPYSFSVPAKGAARIAFAESEAPYTADAKTLAAKAIATL